MLKALYSSSGDGESVGKSADKGGFKNSLKKIAMGAFKGTEPIKKDLRKLKQNIFKWYIGVINERFSKRR